MTKLTGTPHHKGEREGVRVRRKAFGNRPRQGEVDGEEMWFLNRSGRPYRQQIILLE